MRANMYNVELVIKISEDVYKDIMAHNRESREGGKSAYYFEGLIQNSVPLPKGHGKILDEKEILDTEKYDGGWYDLVDLPEYIAGVPAIVEADKGEQE